MSNSSPILLPASSKPAPAPSPVPTSSSSKTIDPQKYYKPEHGDNWRPALQAAFTAAAKVRGEVILERATYNCRQQEQLATTANIHNDYGLALFYVENSIRMRSVNATGSRIVRLNPAGAAMSASDFTPLPGGYRARGGLFVMRSTSIAPWADPSLVSFTAHGVLFDGGLRRSMGLSFDPEVHDKGLWQANDRNGGHITITGTSTAPGGFVGSGGECIYTAAINGREASRRVLTIDENCVFGDTGASALNPLGITLKVERCLLRDSFIGCEGWTGENGGYIRARLRDCQKSSMQGGVYNADPSAGGYYAYTSPTTPDALGYLDLELERSPINLGSGLRGRVTATDSTPSVGDATTFGNGVRNTDLDVVSIADASNRDPGFFLLGGAPGTLGTNDVMVRVALRRTAEATAAGFRHVHGSGSYGSFGSNATIRIVEQYPEVISIWAEFAPIYDNRPNVAQG